MAMGQNERYRQTAYITAIRLTLRKGERKRGRERGEKQSEEQRTKGIPLRRRKHHKKKKRVSLSSGDFATVNGGGCGSRFLCSFPRACFR
jgi:hypothetical protein